MSFMETIDDDDVEFVPLRLPLDRATVAWLNRFAASDAEAAAMIASMIRDIRIDDEQAHRRLH